MRQLPLLILFGTLLFSGLARSGDWPQWRGIHRDGRAEGETAPEELPKELKPLWKIAVGGGFSAPVVAGDKLVYLDAQDGKEIAHVLKTSDGTELWHKEYAESFGDEWGTGPRATPIIEDDRLYVQACNGEFRCLKLE